MNENVSQLPGLEEKPELAYGIFELILKTPKGKILKRVKLLDYQNAVCDS